MPSFPKAVCKDLYKRSTEIVAAYWLYVVKALKILKNWQFPTTSAHNCKKSCTYFGSNQSSLFKTANHLEVKLCLYFQHVVECNLYIKCTGEINQAAEYVVPATD